MRSVSGKTVHPVLAGLGVGLLLACVPLRALARDCFYDGKLYDERYPKPERFTGQYVCKNDGVMSLEETFVDGERHGPFREYDSSTGALSREGEYRHGKYQGRIKFYSQGKLEHTGQYVDGVERGVQFQYRDGKVDHVLSIDDQGHIDAELSFTRQGQLRYLKCGQRAIDAQHAAWCGFGPTGTGVAKLYDEDGKLSETAEYSAGKRNGLNVRYSSESGKPVIQKRYRMDEEVSSVTENETGRDESDCDQARSDCTQTEYAPSGKPRMQTRWQRGVIQSEITFWQNGKPRRVKTRVDDDHNTIATYTDKGTLRETGTYLDRESDVPDGLVKTFGVDGELETSKHYQQGVLHGLSEQMLFEEGGGQAKEQTEYEEGVLKRRSTYVGKKLTARYEYNEDGSVEHEWHAKPGGAAL